MKTYVISDTHFYHKNVIALSSRPFENVYLMNQHMIKQWNDTVKPGDTVIHLGDVSFSNKELTKQIIEQLNGYKILVKGNHDQRSNGWFLDVGFNEVIKGIYQIGNYVLSHRPIEVDPDQINIHGHIHDKELIGFSTHNHINVSVEVTDYKPIKLEV